MTAIVNKKTNEDRQQQTLGKTKKINYIKKYPYWVYIVLGLGLAGLIVAITTTVLISNVYWVYSNYYFDVLKADLGFGSNDFWKLILINPEVFNFSNYSNTVIINGKDVVINTLDQAGQLNAYFTLFEQWCAKNNISPFLESQKFGDFALFFNSFDPAKNAFVFNSELAQQLWNPKGNAYYITTCVFWIVSVITLSIIFFNWWGYIVKQIKANQLPKAERIAAKKAKKEEKLLLKKRKAKIKELRDRNASKKMDNLFSQTNLKNVSSTKIIPEINNVVNNDNDNLDVNDQTNVIKKQSAFVKSMIDAKEE